MTMINESFGFSAIDGETENKIHRLNRRYKSYLCESCFACRWCVLVHHLPFSHKSKDVNLDFPQFLKMKVRRLLKIKIMCNLNEEEEEEKSLSLQDKEPCNYFTRSRTKQVRPKEASTFQKYIYARNFFLKQWRGAACRDFLAHVWIHFATEEQSHGFLEFCQNLEWSGFTHLPDSD